MICLPDTSEAFYAEMNTQRAKLKQAFDAVVNPFREAFDAKILQATTEALERRGLTIDDPAVRNQIFINNEHVLGATREHGPTACLSVCMHDPFERVDVLCTVSAYSFTDVEPGETLQSDQYVTECKVNGPLAIPSS